MTKRTWKLTEAQRDQVARAFARGEKRAAIACRFGISDVQVTRIAQRRGVASRRPRSNPQEGTDAI